MIALNQWWGYRHSNGTLHVKRYFEPLDIEEALGSPFVSSVAGPFRAGDREEALTELRKELR